MQALKGAYNCLIGKEVEMSFEEGAAPASSDSRQVPDTAEADIKFGYCTEFIINIEKHYDSGEEQKLKDYLESIGDSIVLVSDDDIVKIHVHTNDPGLAIQKALTYGSLSRIKIDNMREEHQEKLIKDAQRLAEEQKQAEQKQTEAPRKPYGFISVSIGEGMDAIFRDLGVDYLIAGGQTMNPSTEDMLNAISQVNAETIFILPNNKKYHPGGSAGKDSDRG